MQPVVRAVAIAAVFAAIAPALFAQTIVPNPHLDAQLPPWAAFASSAPDPVGAGEAPVWQSPPDVDNAPSSGSSRVRLSPSSPNAASGMAQCFDFAVPTSINFINYGMAFYVPSAASLDGAVAATVELRLFSGAGCTGFLGGGTQSQALTAANVPPATWYRIADNSFVPAGAPIMAASAQVRGYLRQTGVQPTQSDYALNLDHFVVVPNSTTPVSLIQFGVE
ncbi:MAG TPA: hypothetical protein VLF18_01960 [Tahibacter sp.]|uniref:hypothetical protein n=1 Tax=Tahibacter sp. TaxID=2056211 RepID=UPI002C672FBA|nr:hypothetical protein [Tahibacter sp.]HSX58941.1 hypothetical protein [Tahibacter sp.]